MRIVHYIDDFLLELFPKYLNSNKNKDILKEELTSYYTFGPYLPSVTIDNEWAIIDLDVPKILELESDFNKVVSFCEKKKFVEAKKLLIPLIEKSKKNLFLKISSQSGFFRTLNFFNKVLIMHLHIR